MKTRTLAAAILITAIFATFAAFSADSQEDMKFVKDDAIATRMRPPVPFNHDLHNEAAKVEDCGRCHHVYADGKPVEGETSAGTPCSECHSLQNEDPNLALIRVHHLQCKGCHLERKAGPVLCSECHRQSE